MGFAFGLVGLPNVGKSTLFNALAQRALAAAENYPFCTIEPQRERVPVFDERLHKVASMAKARAVTAARLDVIDIAGLVKGASQGEGLGNQFLAHIRNVQALGHVVRCFEDDKTTHIEGRIDPLSDIEIVNTELLLADLELLIRQHESLRKRIQGGDKEAAKAMTHVERFLAAVEKGQAVRHLDLSSEGFGYALSLGLLSVRPVIYICNVGEGDVKDGNGLSHSVADWAQQEAMPCFTLSALMEAELASFSATERQDYLAASGVTISGLERVLREGYRLLGLQTFFTAGEKEARAWTCRCGATALDAAGVIHTDFARGFICAETIGYEDYLSCGSEAAAAAAGKLRREGKDYIVQDGDVMHFRFNVTTKQRQNVS